LSELKRQKAIFNANIGRKVTINYYIKWESKTVNYKITGIVVDGHQDVIIKTKNGTEFIKCILYNRL